MKKYQPYLIVVVIAGIVALFALTITSKSSNEGSAKDTPDSPALVDQSKPAPSNMAQPRSLAYLIEEEKLAHDVYKMMQDKWGARVFGNILQSESSHQNLLVPLLLQQNIPDPRSSSIGVFTDKSLQTLYDQLIAKGNESEAEAYEVGVIVEETDIADLGVMIAVEKDPTVVEVLNKLKQGSENHLRAFNRQLDRS